MIPEAAGSGCEHERAKIQFGQEPFVLGWIWVDRSFVAELHHAVFRTDSFSDAPPSISTSPFAPATDDSRAQSGKLKPRIGVPLTVRFAGIEPTPPTVGAWVKEDGTITLPLIGRIVATNRTVKDLHREIQERCAPGINCVVIVGLPPPEPFYYVTGEVRDPGRREWAGELTLTQAIQASGDFTKSANQKNVQLIRADGTTLRVNCVKAMQHPSLDPKVMPGDVIRVHRRSF